MVPCLQELEQAEGEVQCLSSIHNLVQNMLLGFEQNVSVQRGWLLLAGGGGHGGARNWQCELLLVAVTLRPPCLEVLLAVLVAVLEGTLVVAWQGVLHQWRWSLVHCKVCCISAWQGVLHQWRWSLVSQHDQRSTLLLSTGDGGHGFKVPLWLSCMAVLLAMFDGGCA